MPVREAADFFPSPLDTLNSPLAPNGFFLQETTQRTETKLKETPFSLLAAIRPQSRPIDWVVVGLR